MAPRKSKTSRPAPPSRTLVLDNGAHTLKAGYVTAGDDDGTNSDETPTLVPNCIARDADRRVYVGHELDQCKDFSEIAFRRPVEKGFVVSWEAQKEIWDRQFFDSGAPQGPCDPSDTRLVLAEHSNALPVLQANCDQMVFEEYGFASYCRANGPALNAYHDVQAVFRTPRDPATVAQRPAEVLLLIDTGYSHTTVTPLLKGRPLHSAVRRLDVGGKLLTNYLARLISLRHYDMRNEPHIVNEMKEQACYVSLDFSSDLERAWKGTRGERRPEYLAGSGGIAKEYVLPDFHTRSKGIVRDFDPEQAGRARKLAKLGESTEDVLTLRNERFTVPEILFHPSDIGLRQSGIANLVWESLLAVPTGLWPALLANVCVVGGNALFEGFVQRLQQEIYASRGRADPVAATWAGGARFARQPESVVAGCCVTKAEYEEYGAGWVARRFAMGDGDT
ncbi:Actin-like protein arp-6 [Apiospora marii]|uniref:Actin-like protein arp-6 n=1 Tax=Apiospora marii TaxID=335849 RepID=UPI0031314379